MLKRAPGPRGAVNIIVFGAWNLSMMKHSRGWARGGLLRTSRSGNFLGGAVASVTCFGKQRDHFSPTKWVDFILLL